MVIFTICSNNYLAQAKILGASIKKHHRDIKFYIFLCDEKQEAIDYASLADEVIPVSAIEQQLPELALRYNIIELNTCIKPHAIAYLLNERNIDKVLYLDPDIKVFAPLHHLFEELNTVSILLTPHVYTPIPIDGKKPGENTFLNYGLYNLGFIGVNKSKESTAMLAWWKEWTYKLGYIAPEKGIFVDQLPINHVPIFFSNVKILQDYGLNMAPWNIHERYLSEQAGKYYVNDTETLKFYHFSSFKIDTMELPLVHYDRFTMAERPDLEGIHKEYNEELKAARHDFYQQFTSSYSITREAYLIEQEQEAYPIKQEKKLLNRLLKKFF
ncbi:hypothetical protein CLV51_1021201 [Chitinophaga niastensis]|uniref:Glycosyl transferase family 8 n=1 Tax=Chitinophaga niastensis TaxID=536980 RepID=A0A2P8HQ71_CHINA|nr:hypothetical protein [Chitinophaga niastensis]PSL48334.1 hypothetical protein CLV51_1021201 [Chitinophaga niastensis]